MDFDTIYQITLGLSIAFLYFVAFATTCENLLSVVVFKWFPFIAASIILLNAFIEHGFVLNL